MLLSHGASTSSTFSLGAFNGTLLDALCCDDRGLNSEEEKKKQKIVTLLLEHGPVNLFNAVALGKVDLVAEFLGKPPFELNTLLNYTNSTLLHVAVAKGHEVVVAVSVLSLLQLKLIRLY